MERLTQEQAFVNAQFGDSMPDVIVYIKSHGSLIINKKLQKYSGRLDSYDLFSLPGVANKILIFTLSGIGNCASTLDPMLSVFPTITPDHTFTDIFKDLDRTYKETHDERFGQYKDLKSPLGSYSVQPLIKGQNFTNNFINKYYLTSDVENGDDIKIVYKEGKEYKVISLLNLDSVAKLLAKKRSISYYTAVDLVETAVTEDSGFVGGYDVMLPGGFHNPGRLTDNHIQRITLRELFYLLYLLGYENPLILDTSCSGNLSLSSDYTERQFAREAAKRDGPFIDEDELLIKDKTTLEDLNYTPYNIKEFDEKCKTIIEGNKAYIAFIIEQVPDCSEKLAMIAANAIPGKFYRQKEFIIAALNVIDTLGCSEDQAVEGIMASKNPDGSFNAGVAIQYLTSKRGGKRIKKTMRRNSQRSKKTMRKKRNNNSIKRTAQRSKKTIKRKTKYICF
jgi:hypothetical protein